MAADPVAKILAALRKSGSTPGAGEQSAARPKVKYAHTLQWYATHYGKSIRTVKRWAAEGLPLDDDAHMRELIANPDRQKGRRADEPAGDQAQPQAPQFQEAPPPEEAPAVQLDASFFDGQGVLAAIERLKKAERERAAAYFTAIARNQPAAVLLNRFKEWTGLIDVLRKLEKDAPEIRKANGAALDRAETEAAIGQTFQAFRAAGNNMPARAARKLVGLTDYDEITEILEKEWQTVCRSLVEIALSAAQLAEQQARQAEEDQRSEQAARRNQEAAE